jgi:hypothetical protein
MPLDRISPTPDTIGVVAVTAMITELAGGLPAEVMTATLADESAATSAVDRIDLKPAVLDRDVLIFDEASFAGPLRTQPDRARNYQAS